MLDAAILGVLIIATVLGFKDGFFRKMYGILGFLGGICAALLVYSFVGELFSKWFDLAPEIARIVAFATIFIVFIVLLNLIYRGVGDDKTKTVAIWSRFAGGAIGLFQGALIASLLLMIATKIGFIDDAAIKGSMFYSDFIDFAPKVMRSSMKWLPKAQEFINELKEKL